MNLKQYQSFLFDLDGTLWDGRSLYAGARELLTRLQSDGHSVIVVSNNSRLGGAEVSRMLAEWGAGAAIPAVTVVDVAADALKRLLGSETPTAVVGSDRLRSACVSARLPLCDIDSDRCAAVLLGWTDDFGGGHLGAISRAFRRGVRAIATNADLTRPGPDGELLPETGSLMSMIPEICRADWTVLGKPSATLFREALRQTGGTSASAVMIGDGMDTDVAGSATLGIDSVWITGGRSATREPADPTPTHSVPDVATLLTLFR